MHAYIHTCIHACMHTYILSHTKRETDADFKQKLTHVYDKFTCTTHGQLSLFGHF